MEGIVMKFLSTSILFFFLIANIQSVTINGVEGYNEDRIRTLLARWAKNPKSLQQLHSLAESSSMLSMPLVMNDKEMCKTLKEFSLKSLKKNEEIFQYEMANKKLGCKLGAIMKKQDLDESEKDENLNINSIYYLIQLKQKLDEKIDGNQLITRLLKRLKVEDSPLAKSQVMELVSVYGTNDEIKDFLYLINDVINQADEVNSKYLQYDTGLATTAAVVYSIIQLTDRLDGRPKTLSEDTMMKFVKYLSTKQHIQTPRSAFAQMRVMRKLSHSEWYRPISVQIVNDSPSSFSILDSNERMKIKLNYLSQKVLDLTDIESVVVERIEHAKDKLIVGKQKPFTWDKKEKIWLLDLLSSFPSLKEATKYRIYLSVNMKQESSFVGIKNNKYIIQMVTKAKINDVQLITNWIGSNDKSKTYELSTTKKLGEKILLSSKESLVLKFNLESLKTKNDLSFPVQQSFIRFVHKDSGRDIFFVAESTKSAPAKYQIQIKMGADADNFDRLIGNYELHLIVGDVRLIDYQSHHLCDLQLQFTNGKSEVQSKSSRYDKKKEIIHIMKQEEKRPSIIISTLFSILVVGVPLGLLVVGWAKTGFNFKLMKISLSAICFHTTLLAIFLLYYCYWAHLDMFTTIKWLGGYSVILILAGQQLLSTLFLRRQQKEKAK
ncbi:hypothetical protein SNEBB_001069 [Seison nebaliae]|nr:hypothetical protein SNEBB_001069 [Seison nebaliae]